MYTSFAGNLKASDARRRGWGFITARKSGKFSRNRRAGERGKFYGEIDESRFAYVFCSLEAYNLATTTPLLRSGKFEFRLFAVSLALII